MSLDSTIFGRFQVQPEFPSQSDKLGIALQTLGRLPVNALRIHPEKGTSGWFIWAGEEDSDDPNFFQPLHVSHLNQYFPELIPYLGLPPGWRVLLAPGYEDVWFDQNLIFRLTQT